MNWLSFAEGALSVVWLVGAFWGINYWRTPRLVANQREAEPRGKASMRYQYTLDGRPTGVLVPEGVDPLAAALRKSKKEGKPYGVARITPR